MSVRARILKERKRNKREKERMLGGSPGLVVMGDNSCSKGRGFESWGRKSDGIKTNMKNKVKKETGNFGTIE